MSIQEQIQELWNAIWQVIILLGQLLLLLFHPVILVPLLLILTPIVIQGVQGWAYKKTTYYNATRIPLRLLKRDKGRYGEYLIYKKLKSMEALGARFLFNVYIPKVDGNTTEIDVVMICTKGIFVFESKNFSGWIFGREEQKNWYQTLPTGRGTSRKESFYNPILQNRQHIIHLKAFLGEQIPMWPMVIFSDKCTLKNGQIAREDVYVGHLSYVFSAVNCTCENNTDMLLTESDICNLYEKLFPLTQLDEDARERHIEEILKKQITTSYKIYEANEVDVFWTEENIQSVIVDNEEQTKSEDICDNQVKKQLDSTVENNEQLTLCPNCNGRLVLKTATRGANAGRRFYGCSNYPSCKYIQKL